MERYRGGNLTDDVAARKTYRYVRLGMIGAVLLLGASVLMEWLEAPGSCWQTSISAYYYTPVRAVFVGALMAIGLCLIVIKGSTWQEDALLNVAGMLAPVVALAPTSLSRDMVADACWSVAPIADGEPATHRELEAVVAANVDNNIDALIYAGIAGIVVASGLAAVALAGRKREGGQEVLRSTAREHKGTIVGVAVAVLILAVGAVWFHVWTDNFHHRAHGFAAIAMFAFLAAAAAVNGWDCWRTGKRRYARGYYGIAGAMAATGLLFLTGSDHKVLFIEIIEIALFAAIWIVQTKELWHDTLRREG